MHATLEADGSIACVIFSNLGPNPRDRIALAAVSRVFRDAEKADASLPCGGGLSALEKLGDEFLDSEHKDAEAVYWWRKGADRGDADCMYAIGRCYRHGDYGVEKDRRKSCEWLIKASELGHADSTYLLAVCYQLGEGVDIDEAKAFELNVKAAELGHLMGTFNLGNLYRHGLCGVAEDKKEALKWFRVAFDIGYDRNYFGSIGFQYLRGICRMLEAELAATRTN
jgi:TPR repeat protein